MPSPSLKTPSGWKFFKVSELFDFIPTGSHSKEQMLYEHAKEGIFNIHYGDIHTRYGTYTEISNTEVPQLKNNVTGVRENMLLNTGDLVMADASEDYNGVGKATEIRKKEDDQCIAGLHTFALRDKGGFTTSGYRSLLIQHPATRKRMKQVSTYSKVYGLSKTSLIEIPLYLPPNKEQERIVAVLEVWDEYLKQLQRKIQLRIYAKAYIQSKMLSGEIRLPGFSDNWTPGYFRDIAFIEKGKALTAKSIIEGVYPVIAGGKASPYNHSEYTHKTAVTVSASGANAGFVKYHHYKFWASDCTVVSAIEAKSNISFLAEFLTLKQAYIYSLQSGGAQPHIYPKDIKQIKLCIPPLDEQEAIGKILEKASDEIHQLEKKKELIEQQKEYLLNKLVTGEIRTPEDLKIPKKETSNG